MVADRRPRSAYAARGIAVEPNQFLHLVVLLDIVLDALQRLRTVHARMVDEAERLLERGDDVVGESAALEPHYVRAYHLERPFDHVAKHERREVLADLRHSAHHRMAADAAELVRGGASADDRPIVKVDVTG